MLYAPPSSKYLIIPGSRYSAFSPERTEEETEVWSHRATAQVVRQKRIVWIWTYCVDVSTVLFISIVLLQGATMTASELMFTLGFTYLLFTSQWEF